MYFGFADLGCDRDIMVKFFMMTISFGRISYLLRMLNSKFLLTVSNALIGSI